MIKVLFVCNGNIHRSSMAEFMFKRMVQDKGVAQDFEIDSASISKTEIGNHVSPQALEVLKKHGIDASKKTARLIVKEDLDYYDFVIVMDKMILLDMNIMFDGYGEEKIHKCLDFSTRMGCDIADPFFTQDYEYTYEELMEGLSGFYDTLVENGLIKA